MVATVNERNRNDREARRLLNDGKTSRKSIAKSARRAEVAAKNACTKPTAAGDLALGKHPRAASASLTQVRTDSTPRRRTVDDRQDQ